MTEQKETKYPVLRARLSAVLSEVRRGSVAADVGTDHAHLPIALCLSDICPHVIASDVRDGPVASAKENVRAYGLEGRITILKTDGLHGIETYDPDDILISGMGGELIVRILSEASFIKAKSKRLVLQPQTHPEILREYLLGEGFRIVCERLALDDGDRLYQIIVAEYDGETREIRKDAASRCALLLGEKGMGQDEALYREAVLRLRSVYERRVAGKKLSEKSDGNAAASDDEEILSELGRL